MVLLQICGGDAAIGPFYCPADEGTHIDLAFFDDLERRFDAPGDFARAYVIAHEIGHHVQHLLGISTQVRQEQSGRPVNPETWTHGSSEQRQTWFRRGFDTGDPNACDTFGQ